MKKFLVIMLALCAMGGLAHGDISWSTPAAISTALTNASSPQVVIDSNNNVTAAWVETGVIKASSLPSGGSWSSPVSLSNLLNTSSNPLLGIDSSGNVTAIWIENTQIESAILTFGGSWSSETSPISGLGATTPVLAVDASGNAVAVWQRSGYIESSTRKLGIWSLVSVLSAVNSSNPTVAISSFGKAIAAWHTVSSGNDVIVSDTLTISTNTWAAPKNLFNGTPAYFHNYPAVAIDPYGNSSIGWYRFNFLDGDAFQNVSVIASTLSATSNSWAIGTVLSSAGIRNPADLKIQMAYDTYGNAVAVWTNSFDGETFTIQSSQLTYGQAWDASIEPQTRSLYSFAFDVVTSNGTALLTTMAWDGVSNITIQSQESEINDPVLQAWTVTNQISTGSNNGYPECAVYVSSSTLYGAAVWLSYNGSNTVINASTGSRAMVSPPTSVSASQSNTNFGVYTDYYNTITWVDSSDPTIVQYNIFRDGVYFTAVLPGTQIVVDHNAINGGTVTYGVAALSSDYRQSTLVTFTL